MNSNIKMDVVFLLAYSFLFGGVEILLQYEKHEAKKDPENAQRHKIGEEIAAVAAVGAGGFAFHEHHKKKDAKESEEEAEGGEKKHHFF